MGTEKTKEEDMEVGKREEDGKLVEEERGSVVTKRGRKRMRRGRKGTE